MPIDKEQRNRNTHNKLQRLVKEGEKPKNVPKQFSSPQGYVGRELQRAARNVAMDDATGSFDYSGSRDDHDRHKSLIRAAKYAKGDSTKLGAIRQLYKQGYVNLHHKLAVKKERGDEA